MKRSIGFYFLLLVAIIQTSQSQIKIVKLDEAGEGRAPSEPSVAINKYDIDNIVVAASIDKYYVTFDGGKTWTNEKITSTYGVWGDPVMINDMKGHFYYFHLSDPTGNVMVVIPRAPNVSEGWFEICLGPSRITS